MNWQQVQLWVRNPIAMYRDTRKARKIEINRIIQNLKNANDEAVTRGYPVMKAAEIRQRAKELYERDQQLRPGKDVVEMVQDLRAGQRLRRHKERREREAQRGRE